MLRLHFSLLPTLLPASLSLLESPLPLQLHHLCHRDIPKSRPKQASPLLYIFTPRWGGPPPGLWCPQPGLAALQACLRPPPPPPPCPAGPSHT